MLLMMVLFMHTNTMAQDSRYAKEFVKIINGRLRNDDYDSLKLDIHKKSIFLWLTYKNCMPCYAKLEKYFKNKYKDYEVNIIAVIPDDPLAMREKTAMILSYYHKYDNIYFIPYDKEGVGNETLLNELINSTSPYFFLVDEKEKIYYTSPENTVKLIY